MMGRDTPLLLEGCWGEDSALGSWVGLGVLCPGPSFLRGGGGTSSTLLSTVAAPLCLFFRDFLGKLGGGACASGAADPVDGAMAEFLTESRHTGKLETDTDVFVEAADALWMVLVGNMTGEVDVAIGVCKVRTGDMTGEVDVAIGTGD